VGRVRLDAPGKLPFADVERDGSTKVSELEPTAYVRSTGSARSGSVEPTGAVTPGAAVVGGGGVVEDLDDEGALPAFAEQRRRRHGKRHREDHDPDPDRHGHAAAPVLDGAPGSPG
jgi:hypothetical protein